MAKSKRKATDDASTPTSSTPKKIKTPSSLTKRKGSHNTNTIIICTNNT